MGCSVYARAIIGVKLPRAPYEEIKERGCKHPLDKGAKFCGKCGAKSWVIDSQPLKNYDEDDGKLGKFDIFEGGTNDNPDFYVGVCAVQTDDCMYGSPGVFGGDLLGVDMASLALELKNLLGPVGLWNDHMKVGLWVFGMTTV